MKNKTATGNRDITPENITQYLSFRIETNHKKNNRTSDNHSNPQKVDKEYK